MQTLKIPSWVLLFLFFFPHPSLVVAKLSNTEHSLNIFLYLKPRIGVAVNLHLTKIIKNCYWNAKKNYMVLHRKGMQGLSNCPQSHSPRLCLLVICLDRLIFRNSYCDRQRLTWIAIECIISVWVCGYLFNCNCHINTALGSALYVYTNNTSLAWHMDIWLSLMVTYTQAVPQQFCSDTGRWRMSWVSFRCPGVPGSAHASQNNPRPLFSD